MFITVINTKTLVFELQLTFVTYRSKQNNNVCLVSLSTNPEAKSLCMDRFLMDLEIRDLVDLGYLHAIV